MADQYTRHTYTLYCQYQFLSHQLDMLCDQYDSWKIRQQRAILQQDKTFHYVLYLCLMTLDVMMKNVNKLVDDKANDLVVAAAISNDMDLLDDLDIEIIS